MKTYSFTLRIDYIKLTEAMFERIIDRLYEAGCNDALICKVNNSISLAFDRKERSMSMAIGSARTAISKALNKSTHLLDCTRASKYPFLIFGDLKSFVENNIDLPCDTPIMIVNFPAPSRLAAHLICWEDRDKGSKILIS